MLEGLGGAIRGTFFIQGRPGVSIQKQNLKGPPPRRYACNMRGLLHLFRSPIAKKGYRSLDLRAVGAGLSTSRCNRCWTEGFRMKRLK